MLGPCLIVQCGRWDLNPHDCNNHKILSLARLPVPTLPHIFDFLSLVSRDFDIISKHRNNVNPFLTFILHAKKLHTKKIFHGNINVSTG